MQETVGTGSEQRAPTVGTLNAIVLIIMKDGEWLMPHELCAIILRTHQLQISDSSVSARLRDLRKERYGKHTVLKRIREGSRAYEYSLGKE